MRNTDALAAKLSKSIAESLLEEEFMTLMVIGMTKEKGSANGILLGVAGHEAELILTIRRALEQSPEFEGLLLDAICDHMGIKIVERRAKTKRNATTKEKVNSIK